MCEYEKLPVIKCRYAAGGEVSHHHLVVANAAAAAGRGSVTQVELH